MADNRSDITTRLYEHICVSRQMAKVYEDEYFSIKYCMKGSAHLTFRKPGLVEKMNDIVTKHFPGMSASRL
ncbi:DUF4942 domain-containing protein [Serratia fonticola]|uniref:DUF4942 domain-containing protein n=1 Tax=Serratia fonticola TaxID=47917 RepID=UPI0030806DBF